MSTVEVNTRAHAHISWGTSIANSGKLWARTVFVAEHEHFASVMHHCGEIACTWRGMAVSLTRALGNWSVRKKINFISLATSSYPWIWSNHFPSTECSFEEPNRLVCPEANEPIHQQFICQWRLASQLQPFLWNNVVSEVTTACIFSAYRKIPSKRPPFSKSEVTRIVEEGRFPSTIPKLKMVAEKKQSACRLTHRVSYNTY